jgi:hypothetical protein
MTDNPAKGTKKFNEEKRGRGLTVAIPISAETRTKKIKLTGSLLPCSAAPSAHGSPCG